MPKPSKGWVLAKPRVLQRVSVYESGSPRIEWIPDPSFPQVYTTNADAKRAFMVAFEPCLADASDAFIKAHFNAYARNLKHVKVLRAPGSKP